VQQSPNNADLWVGLGNALVIHGGGMMSPAAQLAFDRAARISPEHPGPPFFMGMAYAQAGQIEKAAEIWRALLARAPADAPWRPDLEKRIAELEAMQAGR
jgi:cytochrome c-type biogenesis protein CcmH